MRKVIFSKRSKVQLDALLDYLEIKFSILVKEKFIISLDKVILIIHNNPDTFGKSEVNHKVRKCVISKQTTLYYRYNADEIRLLSFFDTRQNPNKVTKIK